MSSSSEDPDLCCFLMCTSLSKGFGSFSGSVSDERGVMTYLVFLNFLFLSCFVIFHQSVLHMS